MYNKFGDSFMIGSPSIDEIVEQNSDSSSGSVAHSSIYRYYSNDKASLEIRGSAWFNANKHSVRPLFLFKE